MTARTSRRHPATRRHDAAALSPPTAPSKLPRALRRRTFRVDGLVALTTAAKAGAVLFAVFYLFGSALLFCVIALGSYYVLLEYTASADVLDWAQLERRLQRRALRLDDYLRLFVAKLSRVWQSLLALQKSTVDYSFTVSIAETESMLELSQLLNSKRLSIDAAHTICRERVFSVEKSGVTELPLPPTRTSAPSLIKDARSSSLALQPRVDDAAAAPSLLQDRSKDCDLVMTPAVRLIQVTETLDNRCFVPRIPVATEARALTIALPGQQPVAPSATLSPSPVRKPPSPKCVVPVVFPVPLQRVVIRPRPSKLTLSQSVERMLLDVERMTREANALLAAGDEVVHSPHSRRRRKSVRFDDCVTSFAPATDAARVDPTELFFGRDEIESMCNAFFNES